MTLRACPISQPLAGWRSCSPASPRRAQQPATPTFGTRTSAVVVDAVVRDKQGRPITDLTIKDFEILEDGVPQEIGALSMIAPEVPGQADAARRVYYTGMSKETAAATTERTAKEGDDVPGGQTIVAIMFDGPDAGEP